ncbi:hypothetical protein ACFFNY_14040 [Paenibacillus hodogayensis]|uniref:Uncharacterized protein n=1 Tax=Paenibacillus hodogayensis TaxID=279208 RepID=A0ABV5VWI6_9BACL
MNIEWTIRAERPLAAEHILEPATPARGGFAAASAYGPGCDCEYGKSRWA